MKSFYKSKFFPRPLDGTGYQDLIITEMGDYSISKPLTAKNITRCIVRHARDKSIKADTILDGTANNGGDSINFIVSGNFKKVISIEKDPVEFEALQNNVHKYQNPNTESRLVLGDFTSEAYKSIPAPSFTSILHGEAQSI